MTSGIELQTLPPKELRVQCGQRTVHNQHEPFCFELFRRAIVHKDGECWEAIVEHYRGMVLAWLTEMAPTGSIGETNIEELTFCPFTKLWRFYDAASIAEARGVASVLAYLKSCAVTCVQEQLRTLRRRRVVESIDESERPVDRSVADTALLQMHQVRIWTTVENNCKDERDRILARLILTTNLKPNEIYAQQPKMFASVDDVYAAKRNLLARLSRDKALREIWTEMSET